MIVFSQAGVSQRNYRIKEMKDRYYVIPPHTTLRFKCKKNVVRKRYNYFYIRLRQLTGNYTHDVAQIHKATSWHSRKELITGTDARPVNGECTCTSGKGDYFKWQFYRPEPSAKPGVDLLLQFDFRQLTRDDVTKKFSQLMRSLMQSLARQENNPVCSCKPGVKLVPAFSQQVLKKLKERIPIPADLPQPGMCYSATENQSYFILVDEDFVLMTDTVKKVKTPVGADTKFHYEWLGLRLFSYQRTPGGSVVQNSFGHFTSGKPTNHLSKGLYLLGSYADIQASEELGGIPYLAIYHPQPKRNNNISPFHSMGAYGVQDDNKVLAGNPLLLHFRSAELAGLDFELEFGDSDPYTKSAFSDRGAISPLIRIYINQQETLAAFDTRPAKLRQLPAKYRLYRKCGNSYRLVKGAKEKTYLLPNDHINYKP